MSRRVDEPKPMDPRLTGMSDLMARKLNNLPTAWLNELLEGHDR